MAKAKKDKKSVSTSEVQEVAAPQIDIEEVKTEKKVDPYSLQNIPKLGPVRLKALFDENYKTPIQVVATLNPNKLATITGLTREEAFEAYDYMKKILIKAGLYSESDRTALEIYNQRKTLIKLPTGCSSVDGLLNGGFEAGSITEVYGENGSGKTQTVHLLAVNAQLTKEQGGLGSKMVFIVDTENTFRPERIISILEGKKLIAQTPAVIEKKIKEDKTLTKDETEELKAIRKKQDEEAEPYLSRILVRTCNDAYQQLEKIKECDSMIAHEVPIGLLLVDSITAVFRGQFLGRGNYYARSDLLKDVLQTMKGIAETYRIPVVGINQIYNSVEGNNQWEDPDKAYGGHILGHTIPYRIKLEKMPRPDKRRMKIMKSPYQANNEVQFCITKAGFADLE